MVDLPLAQVDGSCNLAVPTPPDYSAALTPVPILLSEDCCPCQTATLSGPFVATDLGEGNFGWSSPFALGILPAPALVGFLFAVQWSSAPGPAYCIHVHTVSTPGAAAFDFAAQTITVDMNSVTQWSIAYGWCLDGTVTVTLAFDGVNVLTYELMDPLGLNGCTDLFGTCLGYETPDCIGYTYANTGAQVGVPVGLTISQLGPNLYQAIVNDDAPAGILTDPTAPNTLSGVSVAPNCALPTPQWKLVQEWDILEWDGMGYNTPRTVVIPEACQMSLSIATSGLGLQTTATYFTAPGNYSCPEEATAVAAADVWFQHAISTYGDGVPFVVENASVLPWRVKVLRVDRLAGSYSNFSDFGFLLGLSPFGEGSIVPSAPTLLNFSCVLDLPTGTTLPLALNAQAPVIG